MADAETMSEKQLALWMLNKMRDSEEFLGIIRDARRDGKQDILDTPDYVAKHKARLAPLYQDSDEEPVETSEKTAADAAHVEARDLLSCREELIEKAVAAYLRQRPQQDGDDLPGDWPSTFSAAEAEIEGRTTGVFREGFVAGLADMARREMAREAEKSRDHARDGWER
jgi:hypothetical protein